jgi:glucan phosphoethanolaminetransferase (alkaline phosphatase superfamily)
MKKIKQLILAFAIVTGIGAMALPATPAFAVNVFDQCAGNSTAAVCKSKNDNATSMIKTVINLLLTALGIIAVIMIIIGGIRYTTSQGDSAGVTGAKNTIIYAVAGLVVAILSFAIVNFVLGYF